MLLGELNDAYDMGSSTNEQRIWKLLAFVGRYGHQPLDTAARLSVRDLRLLAAALSEIVDEENTPIKDRGLNE